jgi:hypothetical protein
VKIYCLAFMLFRMFHLQILRQSEFRSHARVIHPIVEECRGKAVPSKSAPYRYLRIGIWFRRSAEADGPLAKGVRLHFIGPALSARGTVECCIAFNSSDSFHSGSNGNYSNRFVTESDASSQYS